MNRKSNKKKYQKRHSDEDRQYMRRKWMWMLIIVMIALLFCTSFVIYRHKKKSLQPAFSNYYAHASAWFEAHKTKKVHVGRETQQSSAANTEPDASDEIHFEFYKTLPAMQMTAEAENVLAPPSSPTPPAKKSVITTAVSPKNTTQLENQNQLSQPLKKKIYILQFGAFQNYAAAVQYRKSLLQSKLQARIIQQTVGNVPGYRIQTGPYSSLAQAKAMQKKVQKLGIVTLVRAFESM